MSRNFLCREGQRSKSMFELGELAALCLGRAVDVTRPSLRELRPLLAAGGAA